MQVSTLPLELSAPGGPLDTFNSLPAHPLLVHAPVVLIPLCSIGVLILALVPHWRRKYGWLLLMGTAVAAGSAFLAKESGEALAARVGEPERHAELGDILPWITVALFGITAIWLIIAWRNSRPDPDAGDESARGSGPFQLLFGILAVIAAILATTWVFLVGDSGAKAVWSARAEIPATAPSASPSASPTAPAASASPSATSAKVITRSELAAHSQPDDCWAAVNGKVYNLTLWEDRNQAGAQAIDGLCGTDATAAFEAQNGPGVVSEDVLAGTQVGILAS